MTDAFTQNAEVHDMVCTTTSFARPGTPEEIALAVLLLAVPSCTMGVWPVAARTGMDWLFS